MLEKLPKDILLVILHHLSTESLLRFSRVNQYAYRLAQEKCLWKHLARNNFSPYFLRNYPAETKKDYQLILSEQITLIKNEVPKDVQKLFIAIFTFDSLKFSSELRKLIQSNPREITIQKLSARFLGKSQNLILWACHCNNQIAMNGLFSAFIELQAVNHNFQSMKGRTIWHYASALNFETLTSILDKNALGRFPDFFSDLLYIACAHGAVRQVVSLLKLGVDIAANPPMGKGNSFLHIATYLEQLEVVEILLNWGAPLEGTDVKGMTPIFGALEHKNTAILTRLIQAGANVNFQTKTQLTPLQYAMRKRSFFAVRMLLEAGATPNLIDSNDDRYSKLLEQKNSYPEKLLCLFEDLLKNLHSPHRRAYFLRTQRPPDDKFILKLLTWLKRWESKTDPNQLKNEFTNFFAKHYIDTLGEEVIKRFVFALFISFSEPVYEFKSPDPGICVVPHQFSSP